MKKFTTFSFQPEKVLKIAFFCFLFLSCITGFAQSDWKWANPKPTGAPLNSVFFTNTNTGYVAGDAGTILKTTDGGGAWQELNPGTGEHLKALYFFNPGNGFVVGAHGTILQTTDGGITWTPRVSPDLSDLYSITFTDPDHGYIAGDGSVFLKTEDGGATWSLHPPSANLFRLRSVCFVDQSTGFVVANTGVIMKTTNGGLSWTISQHGMLDFYGVSFANTMTGFAAGKNGCLYKTVNQGATWTSINAGLTTDIYSVLCQDSLTCYVCSTYGVLRRTTDGGNSWLPLPTNIDYFPALRSICFPGNTTGFAVGTYGAMIKTTNCGDLWLKLGSGFSESVGSINFAGPLAGYAGGDKLFKTRDGGDTWSEVFFNHVYSVFFVTPDTGFYSMYGYLMKTTDGALTYQQISEEYSFRSIFFSGIDTGVAVGGDSKGLILNTHDQFATWTKHLVGSYGELYSVFFPTKNIGFAAGGYEILFNPTLIYGGMIFRTSDGGATWSQVYNQGAFLRSIHFPTPEVGYAAGDSGKVWKTVDSGLSWSQCPSTGVINTLSAIYFTDDQTGYIAGSSGLFLKTTNGGNTWNPELVPSGANFSCIYGNPKSGVIYLGGDGGTILTLGTIPVGVKTPPDYKQADVTVYPNPSGGDLFVKFNRDGISRCDLSIYNATGQQVYTEEIRPSPGGTHVIQFKGTDFHPGVYLYKMILDNRVETGKIVRY